MNFGTIIKIPVSFDITHKDKNGKERHALIETATLEFEIYAQSSDDLHLFAKDCEKFFSDTIKFTVCGELRK